LAVYNGSASQTVKRACIECWRHWGDRHNFIRLRNQWQNLGREEQRMLWLAAGEFADEGKKARDQLRLSLAQAWSLGIEHQGKATFETLYTKWSEVAV